MQRIARRFLVCLLALVLCLVASGVYAQDSASPWADADRVRGMLFSAQAALLSKDASGAADSVREAQALYTETLQQPITTASPALATEIETAFDDASAAVQASDNLGLAAARSQIWANLLHAGSVIVVEAVQANDAPTAANWLILREFRTPTKFSRPGADATLAVNALADGTMTTDAALTAVRDDLLDTYQAKMNESLIAAAAAQEQNFMIKQVEQSALAAGYFDLLTDPILSTAYAEVHGTDGLEASQATFAALVSAARNIQTEDYTAVRAEVDAMLRGFRAAPLSDAEQARRAGQLLRFVSLIPIEYGRGVSGGKIMKDIEVQEALTFQSAAVAAFTDLEDILDLRDPAATAQVDSLLSTTLDQINNVADPAEVQRSIDQINASLDKLFPAEWKSVNSDSDIDVINSLLDQVQAAAAKREYALAESARLEAYAMLEFGIEQRLRGFAPDKAVNIESLFWAGTSDQPGLSTLIGTQASVDSIKAAVAQLKLALADAQIFLSSAKSAPEVVAGNAAIIIFREGLEAILILASLLASLRTIEERKFRRPIVWGALLACAAWIVTWWLANQLLMSMMQFGERLEAVVSLIAIVVLLIITNWFFHKVYWTGWMANFHNKKSRILAGTFSIAISQSVGLAILGFTSIYREGFESVLFLQSLVLEAGIGVVLQGVVIGLIGVAVIGVITFALQMKLPYKKMLVVTGVMIGFVLVVMVGNTVHVMQSVGWIPITPITGLYIPFWMGQWFGVYATWQGIGLQIAAGAFVIGSYFLAERANHRKRDRVVSRRANPA